MADIGPEALMVKEDEGFVSGISAAMQTIESVVAEIAPTNIPVILIGESGSGKALFARRIHAASQRAAEPLVEIQSAALTSASFASEIGLNPGEHSGNGKGASGTILFDEISELDMNCQRSLLYALPDGDANKRAALTARVISTTSRNLDEEMRSGRFRPELYYRINGVCLRLPALRDRKEDIPLLIEFFLTKYAAQLGRQRPMLSARTVRMFLEYEWPGNIRVLENVVKKIVVLGDDRFALSEMVEAPRESVKPRQPVLKADSLKVAARAASRKAEKELILQALERTRWNRKRAAQELQISYKSLLYKLKQIGMSSSESN
jgi:two-component system, NtrC family, response regulator AtoC